MNSKLQSSFDELEQLRLRLMKEVSELQPDVLIAAPQGKWSILEILSHVVASERTGLDYLKKKILGVKEAGEGGAWGSFKIMVFAISQRLPMLKYKAPKVIVEKTIVHHDLPTIEREWGKLRGEWRAFLDSIPEEYVNKKIFRHVIGGRFTVNQGLFILKEHLNHHVPQIRERVVFGKRQIQESD